MKRFEYKSLEFVYISIECLNDLGIQGWELVAINNSSGKNLFYFKREIPQQIVLNPN